MTSGKYFIFIARTLALITIFIVGAGLPRPPSGVQGTPQHPVLCADLTLVRDTDSRDACPYGIMQIFKLVRYAFVGDGPCNVCAANLRARHRRGQWTVPSGFALIFRWSRIFGLSGRQPLQDSGNFKICALTLVGTGVLDCPF